MKSIYQYIIEMEKSGEAGALCTIIETSGSTPRHEGSKMLVYSDGRFVGTVGGGEVESRVKTEALKSIRAGRPMKVTYKMVNPKEGDPGVCGGQLEVFIEPILPKPRLVVVGGGHVGKAVVHLAKWLGFYVIVSDDRDEFCHQEANPEADEFICCSMADIPNHLTINPYTYLVLTTRGSNIDIEGLPELLKTDFAYLGVIGSKRRWAVTRKTLLSAGVSEAALGRVRSPLGLELAAETPEEIAVSILAEIIMLRNGGTGKLMHLQSEV